MTLFSQDTAVALILGLASFLFAVVWGAPLIGYLRKRQIGESIRLDGPQTHLSKVGTPTMGGVMIIVPTTIFCTAVIVPQYESLLLPLGMLIATGVLGAVDDIAKLRQKRAGKPKEGVSARFKLIWQGVTAVVAAVLLWHPNALDLGKAAIPFVPTLFELPWWFYIPMATLYIMGMSNATNLTDGMDGLTGGVGAIAFASYGVIALRQANVHLAAFCFCMAGGILAFLWYNAYPARLFMGDTGSLAIGATLCTVALMTLQWVLLPVVGFIFIAVLFSVIIQVSYFKYTRITTGTGKRIFRIAPLHHHFEQLGWSEVQVVQRFWIVSMLSGMVGIALAML